MLVKREIRKQPFQSPVSFLQLMEVSQIAHAQMSVLFPQPQKAVPLPAGGRLLSIWSRARFLPSLARRTFPPKIIRSDGWCPVLMSLRQRASRRWLAV